MKPWARALLSYTVLLGAIAFGAALLAIVLAAQDLATKALEVAGLSTGLGILLAVLAAGVQRFEP